MNDQMRKSRAQEARGARQHGGRVQPGSGCGRYNTGDVKTSSELIEYKRTDAKSIRVKSADLALLRERALVQGREPLFGIEVGGRDYLIVGTADFEQLVERRVKEQLAGVQRGLGDAGPAQSEVQPATKVRGRGEQRERPVLSGAAPLPEGSPRAPDEPAADGGGRQGVLQRNPQPRRSRVPRPERMLGVGDGQLAAVRSLGRAERARATKAERAAKGAGRTSRLVGGDSS